MTLLTPADAASRLSITKKALEHLRHRGVGPEFVRINSRCVRYTEHALTEWVTTRTSAATGETSEVAA